VENVVLIAEDRVEKAGKSRAKALRGLGLTPGVVYHDGSSILIQVYTKDLINIIKKEGQSAIFDLSYNGKSNQVFIKEIQKDPVTHELLHIDLQPIAMNETMKVNIPINIVGQHTVEGKGGIIQRQLHEIEIEAHPGDIPKVIELDISNLNIGDHMIVEDIQLKEGINVLSNPQEIILLISEPSIQNEEEDIEHESQVE
jgi:large subunit ribosomal protein L25